MDDDLGVPLQYGATNEEDVQSKGILTHKTEKTMQREENQAFSHMSSLSEQLYWKHVSGQCSLHDAAGKFMEAGRTNFVDENFTRKEFARVEQGLLSAVASDILTGNYLLGRFRSDSQIMMYKEFVVAVGKIDRGEELTPRQVDLIKGMGNIFHGGIDDMAEQLQIDKVKLHQLLNDNVINKDALPTEDIIAERYGSQNGHKDKSDFSLKNQSEASVAIINSMFNEDIERYKNRQLPSGYIFQLGLPSIYLRSAGFDNLPITMRSTLLAAKTGDKNHPFEVDDLNNLVQAIQKPIAIFHYSKENMRNLIVDVTHKEKHFLVGVTLNYKSNGIEINSISGLFPKHSHEWIKWIQDDKHIRIDQKEKVLDLIDSLRTNPADSVRIGLDLDFVANIIKKFENPKLFDEKYDMDDDLDVPQAVAQNEKDIQSKGILTNNTELTMQKENNHDFLQEFLANKSRLQSANMEQNLSKLVRFVLPDKPRIMTNAEFVNYALDNGLQVDASEEKGTLAESKVDAIYRAFNSANENVVKRDLGSSYKATSAMLVYEQLLNRRSSSSQGERPTNMDLSNAKREAIKSIIDANTPTKMYYHVKLDDKGTTMPISKTMYEYAQFLSEKQKELMMEKSDSKSESYSELESRVHQLSQEANLSYVPLSLRTPVVVPVHDDRSKESEIYYHATVTDNDILLYQSRVDSYDNKNGVSITDIPDAQRLDVVRLLNEKLSSNDETVSVYVSTKQVPSYALSAIINGDFSGIDNEDDERDIRAFMEETKGMILSPREEEASFNSRPAFGMATDCVPVDVVRLSTIGALRAEYRQTVSGEVYQGLDKLLPENSDKIILKEPFTITSADELKEGLSIEAKEIKRVISLNEGKDVFVVGQDNGGVNTGRLTISDLLHLRDDVLNNRQYEVVSSRSEEESRPYKISYGEFPGVNNIFGDVHVDFGDKLTAVSFSEVQQFAQEHGGDARMMNGHTWADFTSTQDAKDFAERMIELNHEREDKLKEIDNKKTNDTKVYTDSVKGDRVTFVPTTDGNLDVLGKSVSVAKTPTILDNFAAQKTLHPNDVLFFRQKSFVEAFGPDAEQVSKALNIPLYERTFDGRKSSFLMMSINDYINLSENLEVSSRLVQPQVRESLQDIDKSIVLMREHPLSTKQSAVLQAEQKENSNNLNSDKTIMEKSDHSTAIEHQADDSIAKELKNSNYNSTKQSAEDKALDRFADLMIEKMESIQADWKKPWFTKGAMQIPVNMSNRQYNGFNSLMLMFQQEKQGYKLPVWATFNRLTGLNYVKDKQGRTKDATDSEGNKLPLVSVNKGEKSFPVFLTTFTVVNQETKEKIDYDDYIKLPQDERAKYNVYPKQHVYNVFNLDQTNLKEARPELYQKYLDQHTKTPDNHQQQFDFPPVDAMIKENLWICPIKPLEGDQAYYSISKQEIVVPEKKQFRDGESFYSNLFHEMAHSTGASYALDRLKPSTFGSRDYATEELVAELTAALTASKHGMEKNIKEDSVAYLKSWLSTLKEEPSFIKTVLTDVKKAHTMIDNRIGEVSLELDKGILADFTAIREQNKSMHEQTPDFTAQQTSHVGGSSNTQAENCPFTEVKEEQSQHQEETAAKSFHFGR